MAKPRPRARPSRSGSRCELDKLSLGKWNSCEGLGCEVVIEQREEGGNNGYVWQLPTRIKYSNIKLSRPLTKSTASVAKWFADWVSKGARWAGSSEPTGVITAMNAHGEEVASWSLTGVVPVRWTGPSLNHDSPKVATETIEIAHHGFTV